MSGIQHPDDKNTEDISLNRPTKGGETGVASNSHITGFQADGLKKWERKLPRHFPNHAPKKAVKPVKVVSGRKNLVATHTGFATFTAFFPGVLKNCQLLVALPSVDGAKNVTRLIMVQCILPQPMIMLSASVGELTLSAE